MAKLACCFFHIDSCLRELLKLLQSGERNIIIFIFEFFIISWESVFICKTRQKTLRAETCFRNQVEQFQPSWLGYFAKRTLGRWQLCNRRYTQWRNWRGDRGANCLPGKLNVKTRPSPYILVFSIFLVFSRFNFFAFFEVFSGDSGFSIETHIRIHFHFSTFFWMLAVGQLELSLPRPWLKPLENQTKRGTKSQNVRKWR